MNRNRVRTVLLPVAVGLMLLVAGCAGPDEGNASNGDELETTPGVGEDPGDLEETTEEDGLTETTEEDGLDETTEPEGMETTTTEEDMMDETTTTDEDMMNETTTTEAGMMNETTTQPGNETETTIPEEDR